jgi:hypothetical protein
MRKLKQWDGGFDSFGLGGEDFLSIWRVLGLLQHAQIT